MPSGTNDDKSQQQQSKSSAFPSSNLYPNQNIWGGHGNAYTNGHARGPSLSSKGKTPCAPNLGQSSYPHPILDTIDGAAIPSGASHAAAATEQSTWPPWMEPSRPTSTSPNRTRDNGLGKQSTFGTATDNHVMKNGFNSVNGVNGSNLYGSAFPSQKRASNETSYFDSVAAAFPQSRDPSAPPSRHSQGSPAYPELPNGRSHNHAHSSSIHSQRQVPNSAVASLQAYSSRGLNLNKQVDDDLTLGLAQRLTLDSAIGKNTVFDQGSQPFQFNPGSQPYGDANGLRYLNGTEAQHDPLATPYSAFKRGSIDRMSPGPSYRLETGNSPRNYPPSADPWGSRVTSRDPRSIDIERRASTQQMPAPQFTNPFYPYSYGNLQMPPFATNYGEPLRHPMLPPNYNMPHMSGGYYSGNMPPIQPAAQHDAMRGIRSAVLEDFRSNSKTSKRYELKDIYNYIVEFSGDQHGSRFIQSKLETANSDEKDQVFREVEPNAVQLMKDVFGNYVVQKFFEHGNQVQKKILGERMRGKMVELSMQVYACRVVQKVSTHRSTCFDELYTDGFAGFGPCPGGPAGRLGKGTVR